MSHSVIVVKQQDLYMIYTLGLRKQTLFTLKINWLFLIVLPVFLSGFFLVFTVDLEFKDPKV